MRRALTTTAVAVMTALVAVLLPAATASADNFDYRLEASVDGASGGAWFDFSRGRYGGDFTPDVKDLKCDGHPVYISFYTDGGLWQKFVNKQGCRHNQSWGWRGFSYKNNQPATTTGYVYIKVC